MDKAERSLDFRLKWVNLLGVIISPKNVLDVNAIQLQVSPVYWCAWV
jgi:hypothetical protein